MRYDARITGVAAKIRIIIMRTLKNQNKVIAGFSVVIMNKLVHLSV